MSSEALAEVMGKGYVDRLTCGGLEEVTKDDEFVFLFLAGVLSELKDAGLVEKDDGVDNLTDRGMKFVQVMRASGYCPPKAKALEILSELCARPDMLWALIEQWLSQEGMK